MIQSFNNDDVVGLNRAGNKRRLMASGMREAKSERLCCCEESSIVQRIRCVDLFNNHSKEMARAHGRKSIEKMPPAANWIVNVPAVDVIVALKFCKQIARCGDEAAA